MTGLILLFLLVGLFIPVWYLYLQKPVSHTGTHAPDTTADAIDKLLPQTQCGQCGYTGCRPYAEAITRGMAGINQCPPGGEPTLRALARLLGQDIHEPVRLVATPKQVAVIDEDLCIGCVKCIKACPVDAIIGAPKKMHTIIRKNCTGCGLCIAPCPVNCISLVPVRMKTREWVWTKPNPA